MGKRVDYSVGKSADYLVGKGVPFRDAHGIIGQLVLYCIDKKCSIEDLPIEELKQISPVFEEDIYEAVSLKTCVEKRLTIGAPGSEMMREVIRMHREYLSADWQDEDVMSGGRLGEQEIKERQR